MSRLDRHVSAVQNKLALDRFFGALAWASVVYAAALWIGILVDRVLRVRPAHLSWWIWGGAGACVVVAAVWALIRRPTAHEAAIAIDDRLALKEKFSTALYARPLNDPFAQAAVKDAERTADNVSLHKRFPLEFPRQSLGTAGIALLVCLTLAFFPKMNLFGHEEKMMKLATQQAKIDDAKKAVERALQVIVQTEARGVADEETIKQAKKDLEPLLHQPMKDPEQAKRSAAKALTDLDNSLKQKIANNQQIADVESETKAFKSITPLADEKGPVADAQRKIAKGDFADAVEDLSKAVDKFDQLSDADKKKAADQMKNMANALQKMANDPKAQQQVQQQLQQQAGLNQQDAQKAAQLMQQAAQGDQKAQQQLQQMAQQAMQNMNAQQKQAAQQMMKQMQAQANAQQQAQQMAQAAQQMAQAMQQAAAQQGQGQQAQQGQGQQGQQQGQQNQQAGQQMAQAKAQMQQQLGAMQAMKADAQQVAAAQAAAAQAAAEACAACNNNGGNQQGQQGQQGNWQGQGQGQLQGNGKDNGQWQANNQHGPNQGGRGAGDRTFKEQAPYATKEEISHSQDQEGGKILASTLIKAQSVPGKSTVTASNVKPPPDQEATDEIEQERISRPAQQAVKEYFSAWQKDASKQ